MFLEMDALIRLGDDYEHASGIALTRGADNIIHLKRTQKPKIIIFSTQDATPVGSGGNYYYTNGWYNRDLYETKFYGGWGYAASASLYDFSNDTHQQYGGHLKEVGDGYFIITGASSTDYGATLEYWVSYGDEALLNPGYLEGKSGIIPATEIEAAMDAGLNIVTVTGLGFRPKKLNWHSRANYQSGYWYDYDYSANTFSGGQYTAAVNKHAIGNASNYVFGLKALTDDGFTLSQLYRRSANYGGDILWQAFPN